MPTYPGLYGEDRFHLFMERDYPQIDWRTPIIVSSDAGTRLGCRYCIAGYGITGADNFKSDFVFDTPDEFGDHMADKHPPSKGKINVN